MSETAIRAAAGAAVYHVLNRETARQTVFENDGDYGAFELVFAQDCKGVAE